MSFDYDIEHIQTNIPFCLSEEEYFAGVIFEAKLLYNLYASREIRDTYWWPINNREGYIQDGKFRDKEHNLKWVIIYRYLENDRTKIRMNVGDLLIHVPMEVRLQWKKYFIDFNYGTQPERVKAEILFANLKEPHERLVYQRYWEVRIAEHIETEHLPWATEEESEKMFEERVWLKKTPGPSPSQPYRDLIYQYFRPEVLDKYRDNKFCSIDTDRPLSSISFLNQSGDVAYTVNFIRKDGEIMVSAADYTSVPIKERNHWEQFKIPKKEEGVK